VYTCEVCPLNLDTLETKDFLSEISERLTAKKCFYKEPLRCTAGKVIPCALPHNKTIIHRLPNEYELNPLVKLYILSRLRLDKIYILLVDINSYSPGKR